MPNIITVYNYNELVLVPIIITYLNNVVTSSQTSISVPPGADIEPTATPSHNGYANSQLTKWEQHPSRTIPR